MADRTTNDGDSSPSGSARQGTHLLAQQKRRSEALRAFLDEWAEETVPPDPEDVAAMRRRYFSE